MKKTNIEIAYDLLKEKGFPITFFELWQAVVNTNQYSEADGHEMISKFYTALIMDGRFVNLGDNNWELKERVPFDEIALPLSEVYTELEEGEEEEDEDAAPEINYFEEEGTDEDPDLKIKSIISGDEN